MLSQRVLFFVFAAYVSQIAALAQNPPTLSAQVPSGANQASSGTLSILYEWHWDKTYPGTVQFSGAVPPSNAVVSGVSRPDDPAGSNITVQNIVLRRGTGAPVEMYPAYGYTPLFNGFAVTEEPWIAVVTATDLDASSVLDMKINIDWKVPAPTPQPHPTPQPFTIKCSGPTTFPPTTIHLTYGESYDNYCVVSGAVNGVTSWTTPSGLPPGLSSRLSGGFDVSGVPLGGVYGYSIRVADGAGDVRYAYFTLTIDPPDLKTNTSGIQSLLEYISQNF